MPQGIEGSNPSPSADRNFAFGQSRAAVRRGRVGGQEMPPRSGELARRGESEMRGFGTNHRVRSDFLYKLLDLVQIIRTGQKIGLFQIQNPFPQGFDPILSPAFKIFQFFPQSGERAHERIFFGQDKFAFGTSPSRYAETSFSMRSSSALILAERF